MSFSCLSVLLTGLWNLKDIQNSRQNRDTRVNPGYVLLVFGVGEDWG